MPIETAAASLEHGVVEAAAGMNVGHVLAVGVVAGAAVIAGIGATRYLYRRLISDPW